MAFIKNLIEQNYDIEYLFLNFGSYINRREKNRLLIYPKLKNGIKSSNNHISVVKYNTEHKDIIK